MNEHLPNLDALEALARSVVPGPWTAVYDTADEEEGGDWCIVTVEDDVPMPRDPFWIGQTFGNLPPNDTDGERHARYLASYGGRSVAECLLHLSAISYALSLAAQLDVQFPVGSRADEEG